MATASLNVPAVELPDNHVVIKDYSENTGMLDALVKAGVVRSTGVRVNVGHVTAPVAELLVMS